MILRINHENFDLQRRSLTKRKPDLRARDPSPLSYVVFEGVSLAQVIRFLANRLRKRFG